MIAVTENTFNNDDFFSLKKTFETIDYSTQYIKIFSDYREQLLAPYKQRQKLFEELFAPRKALIDSITLPKIDTGIDELMNEIKINLYKPIIFNEVSQKKIDNLEKLISIFPEQDSFNSSNEVFDNLRSSASPVVNSKQDSSDENERYSSELTHSQKKNYETENLHDDTPFYKEKMWYYEQIASYSVQSALGVLAMYTAGIINKDLLIDILKAILKMIENV